MLIPPLLAFFLLSLFLWIISHTWRLPWHTLRQPPLDLDRLLLEDWQRRFNDRYPPAPTPLWNYSRGYRGYTDAVLADLRLRFGPATPEYRPPADAVLAELSEQLGERIG